jgi:predicted metal-dependent phosphoesterase TrpH
MVLLKDIQKVDNGARFHNVDLHIHSYGASHDVKDAAMTPEAIVESSVRQGLSIISITDHNSNLNVQRALDHAQNNFAGRSSFCREWK